MVALTGQGNRDLPRRAALPRFRGEALHSLPCRILCGRVFKWVWEKEKAKLWSILAGHCEHRAGDECVVVASGDAIVEQKRQSKGPLSVGL